MKNNTHERQSKIFCKKNRYLMFSFLSVFITLAIIDTVLIVGYQMKEVTAFVMIMRYLSVSIILMITLLISHVYAKSIINKTETQKINIAVEKDEIINDYVKLIYHDELTNLRNKDGLKKEIDQLICHEKSFVFLNIDLDDFKLINDLKGIQWSDKALVLISKMIKNINENYIAGRILEDSFGLIIPENLEKEEVHSICKNILNEIKLILENEESSYLFGASIGVAYYDKDEVYHADIVKRSEIALRIAKKEGKSNIVFYQEQFLKDQANEILIMSAIKPSLANNDFYLEYQPVINIKNKTSVAVETLIRWNHPELGFIAPDKFIRLAEKTDDIHRLTEFVVKESFKQLSLWNKEGINIRLLINLSPKDLMNPRLPNMLLRHANFYGINKNMVTLEITEATQLIKISTTKEILNEIKKNDFMIAIDDFGTGYSTLTYLKEFPIDVVKLDRSFVNNIEKEIEDKYFLKFVLDISKALNKHVIVEGVETEIQEKILLEHDVTYVQGYYYSKARKAQDLTQVFIEYPFIELDFNNN